MTGQTKPKNSQKFKSLLPFDVHRLVYALPAQLRHAMETKRETFKWRGCIAGGYVRDTLSDRAARDVDYFPDSGLTLPDCPKCEKRCYEPPVDCSEEEQRRFSEEYAVVSKCFDKPLVQLVQKPDYRAPSPVGVIGLFDVTVNQAAIYYEVKNGVGGWKGICASTFYDDLKAKRVVVVNKMAFPAARIGRFLELGFDVPEQLVIEAATEVLSK